MMPMPCALRSCSTRKSAADSLSVRAAVGSSRMSTLQSSVSALAISTSCWLEMLRSRTSAAGSMSWPRRASTVAARVFSAEKFIHACLPALISGMKMFSATVASAHRAISWCTRPMPRRMAWAGPSMTTFWPHSTISPSSGWWMPSMMFISVDFPAPFSPHRAWISPACSEKSTPESAREAPKRFAMPRSSSNAAGVLTRRFPWCHGGRGTCPSRSRRRWPC
ncbi:hypothetical protein FQZ97_469140 [compost metagenome]